MIMQKRGFKLGHKVTVVTAAPSHPYGRVYDGYENQTREETIDGIRVLRLKTTLGANAGIAKRAINYASFLLAVTLNAGRIGKADVVVSTSPHFLSGLAGYPASRRAKAKWILEIRDIWPESIVAVGAAKPGFLVGALSALADWAYRTSDKIVSVSPAFSSHFNSRNIAGSKVAVIPNGVHTDIVPGASELSDFPDLAPLQGRFIAAYVGTFGMAHSAGTIVEAAALLKDDTRIGFLLVGSGAERDTLRARVETLQLPNLVMLDQQPRDVINRLWNIIDASIVHLRDPANLPLRYPDENVGGDGNGQIYIDWRSRPGSGNC